MQNHIPPASQPAQDDAVLTKATDREFLLNQYRDSSRFKIRQRIWGQSGASVRDMQRWLFDRLNLDGAAEVLELGSGPGDLWRENPDRLPPGWRVTLSDLSEGMLQDARDALGANAGNFAFRAVDATAIPFADGSFDAVIANLMLYHVPEPARAIAEIRRVLKPGGRLYAATFSTSVLSADGQKIQTTRKMVSDAFNLENGGEQLSRCFSQVGVERLAPPIMIKEPELLADMLCSMLDAQAQDEASLQETRRRILQKMSAYPVTVRMEYGLFVAQGCPPPAPPAKESVG